MIERRSCRQKRQRHIIVIGNNRKQDIRVEVQQANQPVSQSPAHLLDRINRELEHHRHDLRAVTFRCGFRAHERRQLDGELGARHRIAVFNNVHEYAGVEAGLGFTTHLREPI